MKTTFKPFFILLTVNCLLPQTEYAGSSFSVQFDYITGNTSEVKTGGGLVAK